MARKVRHGPPAEVFHCPTCGRFVSSDAVYSEADHIDPDESNAMGMFDYVDCPCSARPVCLGVTAPL